MSQLIRTGLGEVNYVDVEVPKADGDVGYQIAFGTSRKPGEWQTPDVIVIADLTVTLRLLVGSDAYNPVAGTYWMWWRKSTDPEKFVRAADTDTVEIETSGGVSIGTGSPWATRADVDAGDAATLEASQAYTDTHAGGGGGAVSSVFGRIGPVEAQAGDYTAAQVGAASIAEVGQAISAQGDALVDYTNAQVAAGTTAAHADAVALIAALGLGTASTKALADFATPAQVQVVADALNALTSGSPELLNTLDELASALGDDPHFATTVTSLISAKYTRPGDGIPASDLSTAVQALLGVDATARAAAAAAVTTAAADAAAKANAARDAAISAAALDATSKADTARTSAVATAAGDATTKANAAQTAATAAAATDAGLRVDAALTTALNAMASEQARAAAAETALKAMTELEVWDKASLYPNGAFPAKAATGQAYTFAGYTSTASDPAAVPVIAGGKYSSPITSTPLGVFLMRGLEDSVKRLFGRWTIGPTGTANTGTIGLIAWAPGFAGNPLGNLPLSPCHLSISPTNWTFAVCYDTGGGVNQLVTVQPGTFSTPLAQDGVTEHAAEVLIDYAASTATLYLPDGSLRLISNAAIAAAKSATVAAWELYSSSSANKLGQFVEWGADSRHTDRLLRAKRETMPLALPPVSFRGPALLSTGQNRIYNTFGRQIQIVNALISVGTAPTGSSLIVDVNKNGTTIFTTQANRPTIAAGGFVSSVVSPAGIPPYTVLDPGDYLTIDVDQIGSTTPGSDLTVQVQYR